MMNYTNLDQSFILAGLGIDAETADCYLLSINNVSERYIIPEGKTYSSILEEHTCCYPCWSVYALLKQLPYRITAWDDCAGRTGARIDYELELIPGTRIAYVDSSYHAIISRPLDINPIAEIIIVLSAVLDIVKAL